MDIKSKTPIDIKDKNPSHRSQVNDRKYIPKDYKNVAKGMERQFLQHMIEQMESTVGRSQKSDTASEYYRSLQNEKRADVMSTGEGLGIQDVVLDQIYPKRLRNPNAYQSYNQRQDNLRKRFLDNVQIKQEPQKGENHE